MPERSLMRYELYFNEQPFGLWRDDYRFAQIAALLVQIKGGKSLPVDFMTFWNQDEQGGDDGDVEVFFPGDVLIE